MRLTRFLYTVDTFLKVTWRDSFLKLSYGMRAWWSQARVTFIREIRLITAATTNSQSPLINMILCDFLMCPDVLTDTVHLRGIWGNALCPRRESVARFSGQKMLVLKTAFIIWLMSNWLYCTSFLRWFRDRDHDVRVDNVDIVSKLSLDQSNKRWIHLNK